MFSWQIGKTQKATAIQLITTDIWKQKICFGSLSINTYQTNQKNTYCCKRGHRYSHINHQHCSSPPSPQSTERKGGEKKKKETKITKIEYVGREARDFFMNKMLLKEQEAGGGGEGSPPGTMYRCCVLERHQKIYNNQETLAY